MEPLGKSSLGPRNGFTLVELLAVLAIVLVLLGLTLPALQNVNRSFGLTDAGNRLAALIERARSHSTTTQEVVAIRFFEANSDGEYDKVALIAMNATEADPLAHTSESLTPLLRLPEPLIISKPLSSAMDSDAMRTGTGTLPGGASAPYREFLIFPNGTTSLPSTAVNPCLCIATRRDAADGSEVKNPCVLSIDPVTSRITIYRR